MIKFYISQIICSLILLFTNTLYSQNNNIYNNNIQLAYKKLKTKKFTRPSKKVRENIRKYEYLIQYFSSLNYTRQGYNVNPNYLKALIAAESKGNPKAISGDNAIGLTQIVFSSAKEWAEKLANSGYDFKYINEQDLKDLTKKDLYDPAINILICAYITDLHNGRFGGNLATTVAAWNAGQYAVSKYKGIPPYEETLTLISKVETYLHYFQNN